MYVIHWIRLALAAVLISGVTVVAATVPGRYIVELTTEPVVEHVASGPRQSAHRMSQRLHTADANAHRARLHAEQDTLRGQLKSQNVQVLDSVDTVANAIVVDVPDDATATRIARMPGVKRVLPVEEVYLLMDRAVLLHRVNDVWNQIGIDNAGAGMKIAIIDTGVDVAHAAFQDPSLVIPAGYPRVNATGDEAYTNAKVIVARSYVSLLRNTDSDLTPRDHVGHGTALAMVSAGARSAGPLATITGVAPKAWIGSYKVFGTPGVNDSANSAAILKAIDDAVADGMDVINLSLGSPLASRVEDDIEVDAIERATKAGVIVVAAAGNSGPLFNTISSPATAPSAISVGATTNDRAFASTVDFPGVGSFFALPGDGPTPAAPVSGTVADVSVIDKDGLACSALPPNSLNGSVALILRGSCTFETKLNNAAKANATGAIVYATAESPTPIRMSVASATLPAEMVSNSAGVAMKQAIATQSSAAATLAFTPHAVPVQSGLLADFSAAGPNVDTAIKPDLAAVGDNVYVATQSFDVNGEMYNAAGYISIGGTSFSTPLVAGAAALIKAARPGLTVAQYRSLLINSAAQAHDIKGNLVPVQQVGSGILDAYAAMNSTVTVYPTSLSFNNGLKRTLTLTNLGASDDTFLFAVRPRAGSSAPSLGALSITLAKGASADVPIALDSGLTSGTYDGSVTITASSTGSQTNVPYWYAVASTTPAQVVVLNSLSKAARGSRQNAAIYFRVTDASGLNIDGAPEITVVSGGGSAVRTRSFDSSVPGLIGVDVILGPNAGPNVFKIQSGDVSATVSIQGT